MSGKDLVEISCHFVTYTDKAILINDGDQEVWIPQSQINDVTYDRDDAEEWEDLEPGDSLTIEIPEWLAEKNGLI